MGKSDNQKTPLEKKKDFMKHLGVYLVFCVFFFTLNQLTSPGAAWWYWPVLGWGLGIALQFIHVFGIPGTRGMIEDWEATEEEQEIIRRYREGNLELPDGKETREELKLPKIEKQQQKQYTDDDFV